MANAKRSSKPRPKRSSKAPRATASTRASLNDPAALVDRLRAEGITRAKIGGFDIDGVLRGKYVSLEKLRSALGKGFGFCDVIFGWDVADVLYDNATLTGWHTGYPDAHAVLDVDTLRRIPWEPGVVAMLADFRDDRGRDHPACPRSLLRRVIARAAALGFTPKVGVEFEFFLFQETRDSLQAKHFQDLTPLDPGMFGYSWVRSGQDSDLMKDILEGMNEFGIELEGLHTETGPGVYEAAIAADDALAVADKAALFKTAMKQIVHRHGLSVSFMAKVNAALPGCSGHLHESLWRSGKNAFHDPRSKNGMSALMKQFVAGQLALAQQFTALYSPTINSYKRYVPGVWAPLVAVWGHENRTCTVRVIAPDDAKAARVEYRQTAADINPYIAIAASLGAGMWGIDQQLDLPPEIQGDAGENGPLALPRSLHDAVALLEKSKPARSILGADFVDHYVRTRKWEVRQYERAVTDWELQRYFEVI